MWLFHQCDKWIKCFRNSLHNHWIIFQISLQGRTFKCSINSLNTHLGCYVTDSSRHRYQRFETYKLPLWCIITCLGSATKGYIDVGYFILVTIFECLCPTLLLKIKDVGDKNGQNRNQHLKVVTNTFHLQHPSPTSVSQTCSVLGTFLKIIGIFNFKYWDFSLFSNNQQFFHSRHVTLLL